MTEGRKVIKLVEKLEKDLGVHCIAGTFTRTRAGYWQKRSGRPVWEIDTVEYGKVSCGTPVSECIKLKYRLELGFNRINGPEIFPEKINESEELRNGRKD